MPKPTPIARAHLKPGMRYSCYSHHEVRYKVLGIKAGKQANVVEETWCNLDDPDEPLKHVVDAGNIVYVWSEEKA